MGQRPGVLRVELHRLLRQMVGDGDLERRGQPVGAAGQTATVAARRTPASPSAQATHPRPSWSRVQARRIGQGHRVGDRDATVPAPPTVSVTLNINGKAEDAVTITGQVKERVEAVVRATSETPPGHHRAPVYPAAQGGHALQARTRHRRPQDPRLPQARPRMTPRSAPASTSTRTPCADG